MYYTEVALVSTWIAEETSFTTSVDELFEAFAKHVLRDRM